MSWELRGDSIVDEDGNVLFFVCEATPEQISVTLVAMDLLELCKELLGSRQTVPYEWNYAVDKAELLFQQIYGIGVKGLNKCV